MTQYVKLNPQEQVYGEKNLLFSQASFLTITQRLQNFRKLRVEELMLKLLLKKKLTEAKEAMSSLSSLLPPVPREKKPVEVQEETIIEEVMVQKEKKPRVRTLEDEIDEIRQKIARLS